MQGAAFRRLPFASQTTRAPDGAPGEIYQHVCSRIYFEKIMGISRVSSSSMLPS